MKLEVIHTLEEVTELSEYLKDKDFLAYDCETTGLTKRDEIIGFSICAEESKAFYVVMARWDKEQNKLLYPTDEYKKAVLNIIYTLPSYKLIMHNAIFDCMMAESYFKVSLIDSLHTDTMILAHLLNENRRVGLKELASSMFGEDSTNEQKEMKESVLANGGKLTKDCYEMYKCDPYILGKYGAKDALLTFKLFMHLVPELHEQGLQDFFYNDESMPLLKGPTYELNTVGLQVDTSALILLKKTLQAECLEAKDFIYNEIKSHICDKYPGTNKTNVFNIGASQQLSWLLFGKLNLEFNTLTKVGKTICKDLGLRLPYTPVAKRDFIHYCTARKGENLNGKKVRDPWAYIACDKKTLQKLAPKYKWIEKLLEYQRKTKLLNTYVEGIEERTQYGIIQPSFLQHGTTSGRYSSRNPNFQNLPRDDKRIKACITARPNKVFVGADYSQLEPRVFAYYSKDERLLAAFKGDDDFYSVIGMEVYNKYDCVPRKDGSDDAFGVKYKKLRDLSKVIALASTYGATAHQLAPTTGKSIDDTQQDIDNYFEQFPGVADMMLEAHKLAKETGQVINLFGRPRRMPEAKRITKLYGNLSHTELPYEARNLLNLAVNHRIQSTGASIVNRAAIKFHEYCKQANIPCKLVLQVHDSLVAECSESDAPWVAALLEDAMINTTHLKDIRFEALPKIGRNLSEV
jgi:DNA polymerase I